MEYADIDVAHSVEEGRVAGKTMGATISKKAVIVSRVNQKRGLAWVDGQANTARMDPTSVYSTHATKAA